MNIQLLQWFGYFASGLIAVSMMVSSIVKFRWINLLGALSFAIYGFMIGAFPVMLLNSIIVLVDSYYLFKIYMKPNLFDTLSIRGDNKYLLKFLDFYKDDIKRFFPEFEYKPEMNTVSFFVLRNTAVAGIFLAHREEDNILEVGLDYVIPEYRDYKNGKYVYHTLREDFKKEGYKKVITKTQSPKHSKYLKKLGFEENEKGELFKTF